MCGTCSISARTAGTRAASTARTRKGLVTFDRQLKKDAFYLYKAAWNHTDPFVHLCGSRYVDRTEEVTEIKVYSNQNEVSLYLDGKLFATRQGHVVFSFQVPISGEHTIEARAEDCTSVMLVRKVSEPNPAYRKPGRAGFHRRDQLVRQGGSRPELLFHPGYAGRDPPEPRGPPQSLTR